MSKHSRPRILYLDIETSPIEGYVWGLWDNNVALNQIKTDWQIISYAYAWNDGDVKQEDIRKITEKYLVYNIGCLLHSADVVITQNGKKFDIPKINARMSHYHIKPYKSFQHIDTCQLAKKYFQFTSNKLEYLSKLTGKQKSQHKKFPGFELWSECLKGNVKAWNEMAKYNKQDIVSLRAVFKHLAPWANINFNNYAKPGEMRCSCGSKSFQENGHNYTASGKFKRYRCSSCGSEVRSTNNLSKPAVRRVIR